MVPDAGGQQGVTLSPESICTIPSQASTSDVKMPKLRQLSSNCIMLCFVNVVGTCQGMRDQPDPNTGVLCTRPADILSNIANDEIQQSGMRITRKMSQVRLIGRTNDCHNHHSSRKWILCVAPPIAHI